MPIALIVIGTVFLSAAIRGQQDLLFATLKDDFAGPNNFVVWIIAVWVITLIGYNKSLRPLSHVFLVLLFIVMFLKANKNGQDFIGSFMAQVKA